MPLATFVLPDNYGANLRAEITMSSFSGSAWKVDDATLTALTLVDGGRAVGLHAGTTDWRPGNDVFTGATSISLAGKIQNAVTEAGMQPLKHAGTAVYWSDP